MKVCILLDTTLGGGVRRFALEEVKWLRRLGHEAELVVLMKSRRDHSFEEVKARYLSDGYPFPFRFSFRLPFFNFFSSLHIISPLIAPYVLAKEYDVIVSHATYTCFTAIQLWRHNKIPFLAYIHDPISYILKKVYPNEPLTYIFPLLRSSGYYLDRLILNEAKVCITQSRFHIDFLKNIAKGKIRVIYPGCYPDSDIQRTRGDFLLTIKSMWDANKNAEFLLEILSKLKNAHLVIVGRWEPNFHRLFTQRVKDLGFKERVKITGYVGERELKELYRNARALIHPTVEAFGMSGLEAASYGCPFIMPEGSGVTDIFIHRVHGYFPHEGDLDAYIEYTNELLSNERLAWNMGYRAWVKAKKYTWNKHAKELERTIQDVVNLKWHKDLIR